MENFELRKKLQKYTWMVFILLGVLGFLHIIFFLPHEPEINSVLQLVYKVFIYILIAAGVSCFPKKTKLNLWFLTLVFFVFLGFVLPRLGYQAVCAIPGGGQEAYDVFYTLQFLILYPYVTLAVSFAFRIGGATVGSTFKTAIISQLILFSGYLDIMWHWINPVETPEVYFNAHHVKVILNHYPNLVELIFFALAHIVIIIGIIWLPLDKWLSKFLSRILSKKGILK